jgi:hypothetical protein
VILNRVNGEYGPGVRHFALGYGGLHTPRIHLNRSNLLAYTNLVPFHL